MHSTLDYGYPPTIHKFCFIPEHPRTRSKKTFFAALQVVTDYGACCFITPYLNFINNETKDMNPKDYTGEQYLSQPKGSQSGWMGGIEFLLDLESYDYAYTGKDSVGFRFLFIDQRDQPMIGQDGYLIPPGKKIFYVKTPGNTQRRIKIFVCKKQLDKTDQISLLRYILVSQNMSKVNHFTLSMF